MLKVTDYAEFMDTYRQGAFQGLPREEEKVRDIISRVRQGGDEALKELTLRFDGVEVPSLEVPPEDISRAAAEVGDGFLTALKEAAGRIAAYCRRSLPSDWSFTGPFGEVLGQKITPLGRVGLYIPGGAAPYPSSVLMTAIPARTAGVQEIYLCTPPGPGGQVPRAVLAAAAETGVTRVFRVGGAQAVAALAYGTESIPAVDKICGPGNLYVALAKKLVYGQVGIDMLAGPSEVLIIAGDGASPDFVAADILAQGEHGPTSACYLVAFSREMVEKVAAALKEQLQDLPRGAAAGEALARGQAVLVKDEGEAFSVANRVGPEHLQVFLEDPWRRLPQVKNAGAICLGEYTPAAVGDYWAGPSHVLPTGGASRFSSPLGVEDFLKRSSILYFQPESLARAGENTVRLAEAEGFSAHARALRIREEKGRDN